MNRPNARKAYFGALHHRLNDLYEGCDHRHPERIELGPGDSFKKLLSTVEKAFKKLHGRKKYNPEDLVKVPEYRSVIRETNAVLSRSLKDNSLTPETLKRMREDVFLFSGLKTHAELFEASRQLLTGDGKLKSFNQFSQDVEGVKESHRRYLEAEYDFAVGSVLMADKWDNLGDSDRYNLEYRTAADDRVRDTHANMRGITLPKTDPFWDSYFPPNGWRCRCTTVQVLARNNKATDADKAAKAGRAATTKVNKSGKNKLAIFRFNPGKEKVVFPPDHPYSKVQGAKKAEGALSNFNEEVLKTNETYKEFREKLGKKLKKTYPELSIDEATSINIYTNPKAFFSYINRYNRQGKIPADAKRYGMDKNFLEAITKIMNEGLDKIPDRHKGLAYRGTYLSDDVFKNYQNALKTGKPVVEKSFLSTSTLEDGAFSGRHHFVIKSKNGAKVEKISAVKREQEVLFKKGQKFKVTDIKEIEIDGDLEYEIYMDEV